MKRALVVVLLCVAKVAEAATTRDALRESAPPPSAPLAVNEDSIRYSLRISDNNLMGITVTNYGFFGNNFVSRAPSMEYPLGLGYEHLVRGGLWVGARAVDDSGAFIGVVTGTVDGAQGGGSQSATEFTPAGNAIEVSSKLPNSRYYTPDAVSELDLVSSFSDRPARAFSGNNKERHRPISIVVEQRNYMWSFSDYAHLVIFDFKIRNLGPPLGNAWVGFYAEFASGNKSAYTGWPPSSGEPGLGRWYNKKLIAYDDSLRLFREHFCFGLPVPEGCRYSNVPYWIGLKLLGVSPGNVADTSDKKITFAAWNWSPGDTVRDEDVERYAIMSAATLQSTTVDSLQPERGDPVTLLAVGPFPVINPGDSVQVVFAVVGGPDTPTPAASALEEASPFRAAALEAPGAEKLFQHGRTAQRAYDNGYIVPVPPPSPRFQVVARDQTIDFYWDDSPESFEDSTSPDPRDFEGYRVYIGEDRLDLRRVAQFDLAAPPSDTTGFNTGFGAIRLPTPAVIDGVPYQYRYSVPALRNGFKYFCAVTAYDLGNPQIESLESGISQNKTLAIPGPAAGERPASEPTVFPNPYRVEARWDVGKKVRDHYLWFANLPERCKLRIFTLSGDLVFETDFDGRTYHGGRARGIYDPRHELDVDPPTLSGRTFGWDMITSQGQAIASGLYLYSVEDRASGKTTVGKFLIVKSDREEF